MGKNINHGVRKAIEICGGTRQALADLMNCTKENIRKWELVNCPAERAVEIELVIETKFKEKLVTREEIRPDIFIVGWKKPQAVNPPLHTHPSILKEIKQPSKVEDDEDVLDDHTRAELEKIDRENVYSTDLANEEKDLKAEINERISNSPNVDIARPGRKVREQEQTK